ncbi:Hypothetical_protein [Hexamita inflata]|uniref:Hypothetical_protein n=1 Tax=Hexamita inflata TaxID=28002 RepID=A0AA86NV79_9EUKA|nr:Hypothetical protein HINF_LOCUS14248 [Hexamita inflata]
MQNSQQLLQTLEDSHYPESRLKNQLWSLRLSVKDSTKYRALQPIQKDTLTELKSVFKRDLKINLQFQISDIQDNRRFSLLYFQQLWIRISQEISQEKYPIDYDENMFVTMMFTGPADDEDAQIRQENESPVVQPFIEPEKEVVDVSSDEEEERAVGVIRNSFTVSQRQEVIKYYKDLLSTSRCQAVKLTREYFATCSTTLRPQESVYCHGCYQ